MFESNGIQHPRHVTLLLALCATLPRHTIAFAGGTTSSAHQQSWLVYVHVDPIENHKDAESHRDGEKHRYVESHPVEYNSSYSENRTTPSCGGSIVSDMWVLTSARCVRIFTHPPPPQPPAPTHNLRVRALAETTDRVYLVKDVKVNWQFNDDDNSSYQRDIALIQIVGHFDLEKTSPLSRINLVDTDTKLDVFARCIVAGWTALTSGSSSNSQSLRSLDVQMKPAYTCAKQFKTAKQSSTLSQWTAFMQDKICAAPLKTAGLLSTLAAATHAYQGPDLGDLGVPLVCQTSQDKVPVAVGVVSFVMTSQNNASLAAYTSVQQHRTWMYLEAGDLRDPSVVPLLHYLIPLFMVFGCSFATCGLIVFLGRKRRNSRRPSNNTDRTGVQTVQSRRIVYTRSHTHSLGSQTTTNTVDGGLRDKKSVSFHEV